MRSYVDHYVEYYVYKPLNVCGHAYTLGFTSISHAFSPFSLEFELFPRKYRTYYEE